MSNRERILFILILFFLASLLLPWIKLANVVAVIVLCLYALFFNVSGRDIRGLLKRKWSLLKERKYLQWMLLFSIMVAVSACLSSNFHKGLRYLDPRLALLYLPICIGLLEIRKKFKEKILLSTAWLTTAVVLFCLCYSVYHSNFLEHPELLYSDSLTEILTHQSIYISLLVNISIYIFSYNLFYRSPSQKGFMIAAVIFLFIASYLLASRNMMVVLYAATIGFALYFIFKRKKYVQGISLLLGLTAALFVIFIFFPKTINRYRELAYTKFDYQSMAPESHYNMPVTSDQWNGANFRMAAWQCGWELFLSNPIKGVDLGDKKDALMQKYREKNFQFGIQTQKNVHNNYLDILYSMGLVGLLLFLAGWVILPVVYALRQANRIGILIILTFIIAWVTEIYFDRSLGALLTGFFIPFCLLETKSAADN